MKEKEWKRGRVMQEPVGECCDCGKTIFCDGGFLCGVVLENHELRCYDCDEKAKNEKQA
jgi:hypothetical protein